MPWRTSPSQDSAESSAPPSRSWRETATPAANSYKISPLSATLCGTHFSSRSHRNSLNNPTRNNTTRNNPTRNSPTCIHSRPHD